MVEKGHKLEVYEGPHCDIPRSSTMIATLGEEAIVTNSTDQQAGTNKEHPLPLIASSTQGTIPNIQDCNAASSCQEEILSLLRERLEQVDLERKKDASKAQIRLLEEKESREKAEYLLREGSQLMDSLVNTIQLCLRVAKGDNKLESCTAPQRERDTIDDVITVVSNLKTTHEGQGR